jgi:hypothetical protein
MFSVPVSDRTNDWVLRRWRRYGHDRLYAETPVGARLGYLDMKTGELHPSKPDNLALLTTAVTSYLTPQRAPAGNHASRPQRGRHARQEWAVTPDRPAAAYRARHAVLDWVDLSPTQSGLTTRKRNGVRRGGAPLRIALDCFFSAPLRQTRRAH